MLLIAQAIYPMALPHRDSATYGHIKSVVNNASIMASEIGLSLSGSGLILLYQPSGPYCIQSIMEQTGCYPQRASIISRRS